MAGYSGKPLVSKLDIRPAYRILLSGEPKGFEALLAPLPPGVSFVGARVTQADCVILFATMASQLKRDATRFVAKLPPAGLLWIAWPKKAAKMATDLTETTVREIGLATGLVDVKVCAITEVWSGLKFVRRLRDR